MTEYKFSIGDHVNKVSGYQFPGTIIERFKTLEGKIRYVVEMDYFKLLHIFNEEQLIEDKTPFQFIPISEHEEKIIELEIKLSLWSATFQKYQSWQANRVPPNMWPRQVLFDYDECNNLAKADMQFIPISDAKVLVEALEYALKNPNSDWDDVYDKIHKALLLTKQLNLTTEKGGE